MIFSYSGFLLIAYKTRFAYLVLFKHKTKARHIVLSHNDNL
jgi:hypothetical protein